MHFGFFPDILLLPISGLIVLWSNFVKVRLWPRLWPSLVNVPYELEKSVDSAVVW